MSADDTARFIYLGLLLAAVGGYFLAHARKRPGRIAQQATVWGLIFLGVIAAAGLWGDIRQTVAPRQMVYADQGRIVVPRGADGHYHVVAQINGVDVPFVVDTGAGELVLTRRDAQRVGLNPDGLSFRAQARTANGSVATAPVRLDRVQLGPFTDRNQRAWVNGGEMDTSLMGMGYLQHFDKIEITGTQLVLSR
ncbi:TIGR02281 family clan AA aspartic protease [Actibacterium sp.]|uniref:retropepsin-like aspartic protease family protein n=1 Tax=Actibacterium sp. TaxID=1872125 RepID=UPI003563707E